MYEDAFYKEVGNTRDICVILFVILVPQQQVDPVERIPVRIIHVISDDFVRRLLQDAQTSRFPTQKLEAPQNCW